MDRARDTLRLQEYEAELVEAVLADNPVDVKALRAIVAGYRQALGGTPLAAHSQARSAGRPRTTGTGLKGILKGMLAERTTLSADEAVEAVEGLPQYRENPPTRNTIISRLGDLVREGEALSLRKGMYAAVKPDDGTEPSPHTATNGAGTANQTAFEDHSATASEGVP